MCFKCGLFAARWLCVDLLSWVGLVDCCLGGFVVCVMFAYSLQGLVVEPVCCAFQVGFGCVLYWLVFIDCVLFLLRSLRFGLLWCFCWACMLWVI